MSETWKQWQGRTVDGRFPLQNYLGGSDHSAVFATLARGDAGDSERVAIKLIAADMPEAEKQLLRWTAARALSHPSLIRVFDAGRCDLDGTALLYVVEEYAEENLSQILPERALTAEETRGMLAPILGALQYVHDQGFLHGHIQPTNILAIGDQVKLSSDGLVPVGDRSYSAGTISAYDPPEAAMGALSTVGDVWQLGMTLVEALTQHLLVWDRARLSAPEVPAAVPEPFREIALHCLQVEAGGRWTIAEIVARLGSARLGPARLESARLESGGLESPGLGKRGDAVQPMLAATRSEKTVSVPAISGERKAAAKWPYMVGLGAALAIGFLLIARPKPSSSPAEIRSTQDQRAAESTQPTQAPTQPESKPIPATSGEVKVEGTTPEAGGHEKAFATADQSGVVLRMMPQVSPSARRTIQGRIRVRVKVEVDAAGNVTKAELESAGPSKYFSRLTLEAARNWKFSAAGAGVSGSRDWTLQFAFSRTRTEITAVRTRR